MILRPVPALQNKVDSYALNTLSTTDTDFDGDEIYLEDIWQQTIHVPKVRTTKLPKGGTRGWVMITCSNGCSRRPGY